MAATILLVGWTVAGAVYLSTPPEAEDDDVYELGHSRRYLREMERIGGKAGLLANDLNRWIASLWGGRTRAYTLAAFTLLATGAFLLATRPPRPPPAG